MIYPKREVADDELRAAPPLRVTTWADGFGVWHARVPRHCIAPLLAARRAIRDELQGDVARRCWTSLVRVPDLDTDETIVWREP